MGEKAADGERARRDAMAKAAAPYVHPTLSAAKPQWEFPRLSIWRSGSRANRRRPSCSRRALRAIRSGNAANDEVIETALTAWALQKVRRGKRTIGLLNSLSRTTSLRMMQMASLIGCHSEIIAIVDQLGVARSADTCGSSRKSTATMSQPAIPICRERRGPGRSHSCSFDQRRRPETLRTAMATAFFCPTNTTSRLPRVTPV
jgi:hypothetical protein